MSDAINTIWQICVFVELAAAIRILTQGLAGEYPALMTTCCVLPIKSVFLMAAYRSSLPHDQIRNFFGYLQPLEWLVSGWLAVELLATRLGKSVRVSRYAVLIGATALAIAILSLLVFSSWEWTALSFAKGFRSVYIFDRMIIQTIAIFVVGTWLYFPSHGEGIAPNAVTHTRISAGYFGGTATSLLVMTLTGQKLMGFVNLSLVTVTAVCFLAWSIFMSRDGQRPVYR